MNQLLNSWNALDARRRVILLGAVAVLGIVLVAMSRMATAPSLTLLYSGLESGAAGEVVSALEQRGVAYEVRGGAIFVESRLRDELRMTLASEGLPSNSARGYELLDNLSGFGTTSQMFDAAYWRAKEGELARTIVASPSIASARVHLAAAVSSPFQRGIEPSASVTVTPAAGAIPSSQAKAIRFMVASAVAGMDPANVSVIDSKSGLVDAADDTPTRTSDSRSDLLRERVMRLLEARVGPGNAVVEVSVDTVTESELIRERRFDPESRVAISTDTEERSNSSQEAQSGTVTVASNLPDGDAASGDNSSAQTSESRERVNYEVSETEREIVREPGAIRRITVAVMVNGRPEAGADGIEQLVPRDEAEMADIEELVSSAVGLDEARGDVVTVRSMAFVPPASLGVEAQSGLWASNPLDVMSLIQIAILALVALLLGLFVVRPLLRGSPAPALAELPPPEPSPLPDTMSGPAPLADLPMLGAMDSPSNSGTGPSAMDMNELPALDMMPMGNGMDAPDATPADRLRQLISERREDTAEVLQSWLEDKGEKV